jgi:hypothetical protein
MATGIMRRYSNLLTRPLRAFFAEADPEGLIKMGAPIDEYDNEADRIAVLLLLTYPRDPEDCFRAIWPVFKHWLGHREDNEKAKERYRAIAERLFTFLEVKEHVKVIGPKDRLNRRESPSKT